MILFPRLGRRFILTLLALALTLSPARASFIFTGSTLTEDFNALEAGQTVNATIASVKGTNFDAARILGTGTPAILANAGTTNSGGVYSYGAVNSDERALGLLASGSFVGAIGTTIINNSGLTITSFTIGFDREQWRSSTVTQNVLSFAYALSGGAVSPTNYLTSSGFISNPLLNVAGDGPVTTNGATNGNATPVVRVSQTINAVIAPGATLFVRFQDTDDAGSDAGLAIDNFSFSASFVAGPASATPEPATLTLLLTGLAGGFFIRRRVAA